MKKVASSGGVLQPWLAFGAYSIASAAWIFLTDAILNQFVHNPNEAYRWSVVKGLVFVLASGGLLFAAMCRVARNRHFLEMTVSERTRSLQQSREELRASEGRLQKLLSGLPDVVWTTTRDGATSYISANIERVIGYSAAELCAGTGEQWLELVHPEDVGRVRDAFDHLFEAGKPFDVEYRLRRKDGTWMWLHDRALNVYEENGTWYADGLFSDVSARKAVEQSRSAILQTALDGFYLVDTAGTLVEVNDAYCRFSGYAREELIGKKIMDLEANEAPADVEERMSRVTRSGMDRFETRHRCKNGQTIDLEASVTYQDSGHFVCFMRDITRRKEQERQLRATEIELRQSQKIEAIGRLAGGIAHDFNNILMVISGFAELLESKVANVEGAQHNLNTITKAAERGMNLTKQLLAFGRKQILQPISLELNGLVQETASMLRRVIGEDVRLEVRTSAERAVIEADSDQLVQVLMNLCSNARDAMPTGGSLVIETEIVGAFGGVDGHVVAREGEFVKLSVTDSGCGMKKEILEHIFEPFFTTKAMGKGTGLGLSTVYGIVKQSNGSIFVDSEIGKGTCFRMYFPRTTEEKAQAGQEASDAPSGNERILVVEDEEMIRASLCEFLRKQGYSVTEAESGESALGKVSRAGKGIDLLITDVVMPEMSGRELSAKMTAELPEMRTLFISGYTDDEVLRHGIGHASKAFLQKPFSFSTLGHKIRELLG